MELVSGNFKICGDLAQGVSSIDPAVQLYNKKMLFVRR